MSIKINETIILKVNKQEYDLLLFMREKMPFGTCKLTIHNGKPVLAEWNLPKIRFGMENQTVDKLSFDKKT